MARKKETTTIPSPSDAKPVSDPASEVASALLGGGDSAAPNARPATSTERVREYRKRKKEEGAKPEPISEAEVQNAASMAATIWDIAVVPLAGGRLRRLDNEQAERLGRVTAPLVRKYLPLLGNWQEEVLAAMVVGAIVRECYVPPKPKPKPKQAEPELQSDEEPKP
jgi:hypothetical protein